MTEPVVSDPARAGNSAANVARIAVLEQFRPALLSVVWLTVLTGCLFPLVLFVVGRMAFPAQADGSLVADKGAMIGSRLIGQAFSRPDYFQTRPSAAGSGYDGASSGGTNLGPNNPKLAQDVAQFALAYRTANGLAADAAVPIDAVTRSASGLDPHISPANAALQVARVARARGLSDSAVRRLVDQHTEARQLGFMGEPRVSVLGLNLALDRMSPPHVR